MNCSGTPHGLAMATFNEEVCYHFSAIMPIDSSILTSWFAQIIWVGWLNPRGKEVREFCFGIWPFLRSSLSLFNILKQLYTLCSIFWSICTLCHLPIAVTYLPRPPGFAGLRGGYWTRRVYWRGLRGTQDFDWAMRKSKLKSCIISFLHISRSQGPGESCSRCWESGALLINPSKSGPQGQVAIGTLVIFLISILMMFWWLWKDSHNWNLTAGTKEWNIYLPRPPYSACGRLCKW